MMREQVAICTRIEVGRERVATCVRLTVSRADRRERCISIVSFQALTHDRRKDDEPHGEQAKPCGHSIAGAIGHDVEGMRAAAF
ncbi:hypothetical protein VL15_16285 [Burkholderia cepacia]|uniref:Uncharacterized protein n=1 Tax=Burkholderia cepacia TaxID=292 RepID=A0A0J5X021_BURCE|nr:hypothetical protein VL15_16285 [Burkholderia cepacia]